MPPETTPAGAMPAAAGATPAQTPPADQAPAAQTPPATGAQATDDPSLGDAGKKALDAERDARRDAEKRAKAAEDELKKLKDASLSENERRDKRLADLERAETDWQRERQDLVLRSSVERQAVKLGFADPTDALGLLDRTSIEYEPDGSPRNVEQLLTALAKGKPYLLAQRRSAGSFDTGTGGGQSAAGRTYTRAELRDPKFYEANREDITKAAAEGRIQA
jgi:hypothetical protein